MEWAWLIPVFSFAAVPLIIIFGKFLPGKGSPLAIAAILGGFIIFWFVFAGFLAADSDTQRCHIGEGTEALTCNYKVTWFEAGIPDALTDSFDRIHLEWGILVDPLTIAMLGLATFVALMVQIYSLGYMKDKEGKFDERLDWYYAFHALFIASMLTLVLADNFLLLYIAWELVGLCSYLLIGFWHERPEPREAAKKAFIVTRIGDVGLLVGILLLWSHVGSFSMLETFAAIEAGELSQGVVTVSALLLFLGAMGKSAQFPFHVWLPDAMEGPTPVSALIHAATMVAAGVYLVARAFPIFSESQVALYIVASIGLITALGAATIALVATDLKRILAYSTISHLGLMMLSLGALGYTAAIFHLLAHGFAKALLFLGAGSVMHSTEELDVRKMGGLRKVMPVTAILFSIGALSLGGIPILAGFWSKDEILIAVNKELPLMFIVLTLLTALLSALYMARAMFVVFYGRFAEHFEHVHDAPKTMSITMGLLAVFALVFGLVALDLPGPFKGIGYFIFYHEGHGLDFEIWLAVLSTVLAVAAFIYGYMAYARKSVNLEGARQRFALPLKLAEGKYYIDELYQWSIDRVVLSFSRFIAWIDRALVNDVGINGPADVTRILGHGLRRHVTGYLYSYALAMALGLIGLAILWWIVST